MSKDRWITPAVEPSASSFYCRRFLIPQQVDFIAIFNGALDELRFSNSFETLGGVSPARTAELFQEMIDRASGEDWCMIGVILPYATTVPPINTLACDGASYLRIDYPDLYAALGSPFVIDANTFVTPDLRGRVPLGTGTGSGLSTRALGDQGGEETHQLNVGELAAHAHTDTGHIHSTGNSLILGTSAPPPLDALGPNPLPAFTGSASANITSTGSDTPHNNMQPWLALNYAIIAK
jgi:microcystin-dependent protein